MMKTKIYMFITVVFAILLALSACQGSVGPQGPQGEQGQQGPVGPAGEDGSMIYAGEGVPSNDVGDEGDYYLDNSTGEFYGPKDTEGWGDPIIVLMGENSSGEQGPPGPQGPQGPEGPAGEDGRDGEDGEDGSQIYAGDGAPDTSEGSEGDYYLDKDNYHLYGPKTGGGWGSPLNLKGADGSDNVTRYIFPGHDFTSSATAQSLINGVENGEESAWLIYLFDGDWKYFVPGYGKSGTTAYRAQHGMGGTTLDSRISRHSGPGEVYSNIYIIRIQPGSTEDHTKIKGSRTIIPEGLDISDYEAVAKYYGFK